MTFTSSATAARPMVSPRKVPSKPKETLEALDWAPADAPVLAALLAQLAAA